MAGELKLHKMICPQGHDTLTVVAAELANGVLLTYCSTCDKEYKPDELVSIPVDRRKLGGDTPHPTVYGQPH